MSEEAALPTVPILSTKLHAPRRRRGLVHRQRLLRRLDGVDRPRLVLVSAPAGFGKSTLLAEWLADGPDVDRHTAWLSLDRRDDDPTVFWSYVVAALRTVLPDVGDTTLDVLRAAPADPSSAVAALVGELDAALGRTDHDVTLVLDDYHVVESPEIHASVAFLLDHLPARVLLAIATRVDPPLPLGRLRASGELVECRAGDLRFTEAETASYFNDTMGLDLGGDAVGALEARTEGWIAALQLAALSMQGRDDVAAFVESFTGDDRFVVDYLVEEVLDRQPPEVRQFLLATSVLGRMTGELCDAVVGGTAGRATLEQLDRSNLFVVPLDDRRVWYRYHHLFGDVLRARLVGEQPDVVADLHRRAATWLAAHDDASGAIAHALEGGDVGLAADLLEATAASMLRVRQEVQVRAWLEALPVEIYADRPVLSVLLVGARMSTGDPTGVDELLTATERWLPGSPDRPEGAGPVVLDADQFASLPAQVEIYRAALALLSGDVPGTIRHAEHALELAAPIDDDLQVASATALVGLARWSRGEIGAARQHYEVAIDRLERAGNVADVLGCLLGFADMCRAEGCLHDALAALERGLALVASHPGLRGAADMHTATCELLLDRNEVERAREHLEMSIALGERAGLPQHPYRWRVAAARIAAVDGDVAEALRLLDEADEVYHTDFSPSVRPVPAVRARLQVREGDLDAALRWAALRGLGPDDELAYVTEFEHVTLATALVAQQVRDRQDRGAIALLDRLLAAAEEGGRSGVVVDVLVLLAVAHDVDGDRAAALTALRRALELAEPERLVRVFLDQGPTLLALLRSASFDGAAGVHCGRVLAGAGGASAGASGSGRASSVAASPLVDELSARELDVLRLLRSELSGPEIARELIVSLNTMRTHTKNIYAKLGVTNRREAVRRAEELGL